MQGTVVLIHSVPVMIEPMKKIFRDHLPGVRVVNIMDDSLLPEVVAAGRVTPGVFKRVTGYITTACDIGADIVMTVCTTLSDVVDVASRLTEIPVMRIDEPMIEDALDAGCRLAVVATFEPTLGPSIRLVERMAHRAGTQVHVEAVFVPGAFDAVLDGDLAGHDAMVKEHVLRIAPDFDAVLLAQGSMASLEEPLRLNTGKPVLSSPRRAVARVGAILAARCRGKA